MWTCEEAAEVVECFFSSVTPSEEITLVKLLLSTTMDCLKLVEEEVVVETWLSSRTC